jgi:hypothetical protein
MSDEQRSKAKQRWFISVKRIVMTREYEDAGEGLAAEHGTQR